MNIGIPYPLRVLCTALACLLSSGPHAAIGVETSFAELLADLHHAPSEVRVELAEIALDELALAYRDVADKARQDSRRQPDNRDLARWSRSVEALADEMDRLAGTVYSANTVDWLIGPDRSLTFHIDGRPVPVTGPRPNEQKQLERRILQRFCATHLCAASEFALFDNPAAALPTPAPRAAAPTWRFSQYAGPICETDSGLEFQFSSTADLQRKRLACAALVDELNGLVLRLAEAAARHVDIDWSELAVRPDTTGSSGGRHRVILNYHGDELQLALPHLAASPTLVTLLRPWLVAQVRGDDYPLIILNADILMPLALR